MSTYSEMAPTIQSTGITKTQVEAYFAALPEPPPSSQLPSITKSKVEGVANKVYDGLNGVSKHGGILKIARSEGLTSGQVKKLIVEMETLHSAWHAANNPEA